MTARRALWMSQIGIPPRRFPRVCFLRLSHKEMPNLIISDSETDDLIAYMINLKQPSAPTRPQVYDQENLLQLWALHTPEFRSHRINTQPTRNEQSGTAIS
jgi:hypothetical protein